MGYSSVKDARQGRVPHARSLVAAFILLGIVLPGAVATVCSLLVTLATTRTVASYPDLIAAAIVVAAAVLCFRPSVLKRLSWKQLSDIWLKMPWVSSFSVMGFAFIASKPDVFAPVITIDYSRSSIPLASLGFIFTLGALLFGLANLLWKVGVTTAQTEDGNTPLALFVPTAAAAIGCNLMLSFLFIDAMLLTLMTRDAAAIGAT